MTSKDTRTFKSILMIKCLQDPEFKQQFLANPKNAIEKTFGTQFPKNLQFKAFEDTDTLIHIVLPTKENIASEIDEEELKSIAAGGETHLSVGQGENERTIILSDEAEEAAKWWQDELAKTGAPGFKP